MRFVSPVHPPPHRIYLPHSISQVGIMCSKCVMRVCFCFGGCVGT